MPSFGGNPGNTGAASGGAPHAAPSQAPAHAVAYQAPAHAVAYQAPAHAVAPHYGLGAVLSHAANIVSQAVGHATGGHSGPTMAQAGGPGSDNFPGGKAGTQAALAALHQEALRNLGSTFGNEWRGLLAQGLLGPHPHIPQVQLDSGPAPQGVGAYTTSSGGGPSTVHFPSGFAEMLTAHNAPIHSSWLGGALARAFSAPVAGLPGRDLYANVLANIGHNWAKNAIVHELSHTQQHFPMTVNGKLDIPLVEGAAQAYTNRVGPSVIRNWQPPGDGSYHPYVSQVNAFETPNWITHGQFAHSDHAPTIFYPSSAAGKFALQHLASIVGRNVARAAYSSNEPYPRSLYLRPGDY